MTRHGISLLAVTALALAGCAARPGPVSVAEPPPPPAVVLAPMPAGGYPGMAIPAMLADGSYDTPNRRLTPAAAMWHLRAGLNVAALACGGGTDAALVARYNTLLGQQKLVLRDAERTLAAEYRAGGGAGWRADYDSAMTRLYNFYAQSFAHPAFCASAAAILDEAASVEPTAFPDFAARRLPLLDRAFTDFYRAYDAWRSGQAMASMSPGVSPGLSYAAAGRAPMTAASLRQPPRIELDMAALNGR